MAATGVVLPLTLLLLAAERGVELVINARHARELRRRGAVWMERDGFGMLVAVQALLFAGLALEGALAPWTGVSWWTWPLLGVALILQGARYWVIATLGWRWTVRVATVPGSPRVTGGPYRWVRHPNYLVVALETLVLPAAFGAWATLALVLPFTLVALARRIRREERALKALPGG
ncbi:MAG TPA: isoprenylcysteine carboxylmethyltransferase family protein [Candidatus Thermoplasmatota archaeon]|nr:isoprenylcysteine carboxylmethyltransferase family protein [Candidatus Thermoplasmatota archaeon]